MFLLIHVLCLLLVSVNSGLSAELPDCDLSAALLKDCQAYIYLPWRIEQHTKLDNVRVSCDTGRYDCIYVSSDIDLYIANSVIEGNNLSRCIYMWGGDFYMENSDGFNCGDHTFYSAVDGGFLRSNSRVTINNSSLYSNYAADGGAIYVKHGVLNVTNSSFYKNRSSKTAACLTIQYSHARIVNSYFYENGGVCGGILAVLRNSSAEITGSLIQNNVAYQGVGALLDWSSELIVKNTVMDLNDGHQGLAIFCRSQKVIMDKFSFQNSQSNCILNDTCTLEVV